MDAYDVVEEGLRLGMSIFTFDFAGSGHSEGEYVSMGLNESMDIKVVVEYL
jgi:alpha/beta superfamily hydrolase